VSEKERKESFWVKIYIAALFFCGVALWYSMQPLQKNEVAIDIELDKKIVDILAVNGVEQGDIVKQYVQERSSKGSRWNEYYKSIKLNAESNSHIFESTFRSIARVMKVGLSVTENDDGSVTYKFYSPNRTYSNITFIKVRR
jgi:hypothetical protein